MGRLFINNQLVDLPENFVFARTKQVNTIGRLDNRQASYTQNIRLPRTKNNTRIFEGLGTLGALSNVPYTVNNVRFVNDSGIDEIFNGVAIFRRTNQFYNLAIYDGYISFAKAIENRVLTDVDLTELNHLKNLDSVEASWTNDLNYRYLVADYNGRTVFQNRWNIDFLIPSVNMKYLWDKVHEFAGFTYSGSALSTDFFESLWVTYPKTIGEGTQQTVPVFSINWISEIDYLLPDQTILDPVTTTRFFHPTRAFSGESVTDNAFVEGTRIQILNGYLNDLYFRSKASTLYRIEISGRIIRPNAPSSGGVIGVYRYNDFPTTPAPDDIIEIGAFEYGQQFSYVDYVTVGQDEYFAVTSIYNNNDILSELATGNVTLNIQAVTGNTVDFQEAFIDFGMQDFINEVLWRLSLTPFVDKYTNHVTYLTTQEWLQGTNFYDWSADQNRYIEQVSETYVLPGYAQRNYMRYKYNDENFNHNDGFLTIENKNLQSSTDIINSNLFSPDFGFTQILGAGYRIYPFWDREPQEDGTIQYKELENRFYIMRSQQVDSTIQAISEINNQTRDISQYQRESFEGLNFQDLIRERYRSIYSILNRSRMVQANIFLDDNLVGSIDFRRLVYIREQGTYFLIDKIPNYRGKGVYRVDLIEVDRNVVDPNTGIGSDSRLEITTTTAAPEVGGRTNWAIITDVTFLGYEPSPNVINITAAQLDDQGNFTGVSMTGAVDQATWMHTFELPEPLTDDTCGRFRVVVTDSELFLISNEQFIDLPCNTVHRIIMESFNSNTPSANPITRLFQYQFINFTPASATLEIQATNPSTNAPIGAPQTVVLTNLAEGTLHSENITYNQGSNYYVFTMTTDTIVETYQAYVL